MAMLAGQRRRIQRLEGRLQQAPGSEHALVALDRDRRMGGNLLAAALAFRMFAVMLPLALLAAVALGYAATVDRSAPGEAGEAVGIGETTLSSVAESSRLESDTRWLVAASALVMLVYAATKAARAVHAAHCLAWTGRVERMLHPLRAALLTLAAIAGIALIWAGAGAARAEYGAGGTVLAVLSIVPFFGLWLGMALLLPHAGAPWAALVPGAALVAVGLGVIHLGTVLFVSHQIERSSSTYGPLGAAFTILVWLFVISRVLVGSAMLNAALWHRRDPVPVES